MAGKVVYKSKWQKLQNRSKRQNRLGIICVSIIVLMLFLVLMVKSRELSGKLATYEKKEKMLQEQIEAEEARTEELVEYEKYTKTARYVEEVAKEKLGLVYEDEIVFESEDGN